LQESRSQNYIQGAAILAAASIFVKIIGAVYKIPILKILDDGGRGSFQVTYNVYTFLLVLSTAGVPAALSRLISSAAASGKAGLAKRFFSVSLPAFVIIGTVAMLMMFLFADALAGLMGDSLAAPGIRVLAPAVFFACIISIFRGYAQGYENMIPTAVSQVIEVLSKAAFGIVAALLLTGMGYAMHIVSAGAIMGVTIGLGLCVPLLVWYKRKLDRTLPAADESEELPGKIHVLGRLFKVSIPITLSASMMAIMTFIDTAVVMGRLQTGALMLTEAGARSEFGKYALSISIYTLPLALIVPLSISIIPAIAAALARKQATEAGLIMKSSVKLVNLLAMPAAAGLMVLASPIMIALYNDSRELPAKILLILGAASLFTCLQYITTAILQANGHERIALMTFPVGAVVKIALSYILVANADIGILGSPVGTLACFAIIVFLNIVFIKIKVREKLGFITSTLKPLACTLVMAAVVYFVYAGVSRLGSAVISAGQMAVIVYLGIAVLIGVSVYAVMIVVTRTITKEDLAYLPKGDKLAKLLRVR